jgi:L-amino acid N-acyltransferase YncA
MPIDHAPTIEMNLRAVKAEDSADILRWRNDDVTRAMSLNSDLIEPDRHSAWFSRFLENERTLAFVGIVDGRAVGWVRFDALETEAAFLVSITVAPEARSKGMGSQLLELALRKLRTVCSKPVVYAKVKETNLASRKVFQKLGFRLSEESNLLQTLVLA